MTADIVTTHRIFPQTLQLLSRVGRVLSPTADRLDERELAEAMSSTRALMVFMPDRVDDRLLSSSPRISIIAAALKGYDNIDVEACTDRGVWLSIVPDLLTAPTAELTVGLVIGLARHLRHADRYVRSGDFVGWTPNFYGLSIAGSTVGIVGMGAVGRATAERFAGFGCRLICWDKNIKSAPGVERRPLDVLLSEADIVVLCLPLEADSLHLLNKSRLARMKPGALLVNPARGSLVDEEAVAEALERGRLGGYAADVFEMEDLSRDDRPRAIPPALLAHPHTLFGAHIGSATIAARTAIEARAAENIIDVFEGRPPRDAINDVRRHGA